MTKYNLTEEPDYKEELASFSSAMAQAAENVARAETIVRNLGLTELELHILARRLLDD